MFILLCEVDVIFMFVNKWGGDSRLFSPVATPKITLSHPENTPINI